MVDPQVLRQAQLIMLDMLVEFDAICKKHQLQYWLDSGTLLGAVRHQGFIPWDDDIDISMPVEDYKKFLAIAAAEVSNTITVQTAASDPAFKFDYIKLRSNKARIVEFHEKDKDIQYHQGVFVDIFPMLTLEDNEENQRFYQQSFEKIRAVSAVSLHTPQGKDQPKDRAELVAAIYKKHQGWKGQPLKVIYGGEMPDVAAWFDIDQVFPLSEIEFEGQRFSAPKNPSHYLDAIYTFDYRQLPPEDQRVTHALAIDIL